jgi:hypothetical protein
VALFRKFCEEKIEIKTKKNLVALLKIMVDYQKI